MKLLSYKGGMRGGGGRSKHKWWVSEVAGSTSTHEKDRGGGKKVRFSLLFAATALLIKTRLMVVGNGGQKSRGGGRHGAQPTHINTDIQLTKIVLSYSQLIYTAEPVQVGVGRQEILEAPSQPHATRVGGSEARNKGRQSRKQGWTVFSWEAQMWEGRPPAPRPPWLLQSPRETPSGHELCQGNICTSAPTTAQ